MADSQDCPEKDKTRKDMPDLDDKIRVQRAGVKSLSDSQLMAETEMRKLESLESLLKDAIITQNARYQKLGSSSVASSVIYEAYHKLESLKSRLRD